MKFSSTLASAIALASSVAVARPSNKVHASSPLPVARSEHDVRSIDFAALAERGLEMVNDFLNDNQERSDDKTSSSVHKRSIAVRSVAIKLRDQLHSGDVDLNKAVDGGLSKFSATAQEVDFNDVAKQGLALVRDGVDRQDFNKLAQALLSRGTQKLTKRDTWSWAGLIQGPILRTAAKVGVKLASKAIGSVDLNKLAQKAMGGLESRVGGVDANSMASQSASMLSNMLSGVDVNGIMKTAMGFLFPTNTQSDAGSQSSIGSQSTNGTQAYSRTRRA